MAKKGLINLKTKEFYSKYIKKFLEENSKINLISKNDEKYLWEKHIFDSLAIENFFNKYTVIQEKTSLLDIGTGGGFPAIPIAMTDPEIEVTAIDSIKKKINANINIKNTLGLDNLSLICDRVENLKNKKFDIITSRAVADLGKISEYALPLLKKNGYFIAYKSQKAKDEIERALPVLKHFKAEVKDIINYRLPLEEIYDRNLIVISWI